MTAKEEAAIRKDERRKVWEETAKIARTMQEAAWHRLERRHNTDAAAQESTASELAESFEAKARAERG
jgi:hypothetical protein